MTILLMTAAGTVDLSKIYLSLSTSGSKSSCARQATVKLPASGSDPYLPRIDVACGDRMVIRDGERTILDGFVVSVATGSDIAAGKTVKIYDRGLQLNNNDGSYAFKNATPEAIARKLCAEFGVEVGSLPDTGSFKLTRNFVGVSLYKIIATAYTMAAGSTGKQYMLRFEGEKFCVRVLERSDETLYLKPGSNLLSATSTISMEKMVNQVLIVDKNGNKLSTKDDAASQAQYGVWRSVVKQSDNAAATAAETLRDYAEPTYTINVEGLGDWRCIAGSCVGVQERQSGLWGVFAIESDTHTIASGYHTMKLMLTLRNLMSEVEAGSEK